MYLDSLLIKDSKKKTKYDAMTSWSSKYDAMPWLSFKNQPFLKQTRIIMGILLGLLNKTAISNLNEIEDRNTQTYKTY